MMGSYGPGYLIFALVALVIPIWLTARIAGKAGFSGWWGLVSIIPLLNLVMIWVFAFSDWPAAGGGPGEAGTDASFSRPDRTA